MGDPRAHGRPHRLGRPPRAVEQAVATGAIRPVDPLLVSLGLWAAVHGITSLLVARPGFPWPDQQGLVDHVLRTQLEGLLPDSPPTAKEAPGTSSPG